jgi:glycosyltransferase involved in cell wall biosynthesis
LPAEGWARNRLHSLDIGDKAHPPRVGRVLSSVVRADLKMIRNLHIMPNSCTNGSRVLKETKSLVESGLVDEAYIFALEEEGFSNEEVIDENRTLYRVQLKSRGWHKNPLTKIVIYIEYFWKCLRFVQKNEVDIVNVHILDLLPMGVFIKWICGTKLIYDAHELETETVHKRGLSKKLSKLVERLFIAFADMTIVVGKGIEDWYRETYNMDKIITVMNCPWHQEPYGTNYLREQLDIPETKKIVLYQGGLFLGRGIEGLLDAFAREDDGKHVFVCMGFGELDGYIRSYAEKHQNIYLQPAAHPDEILYYTCSADCGVAYIDNPSLNDRLCLPNKLFEFLMAGLPVMVNDAPEMKRLVEASQVGAVLSELNYDEILRGLSEIAQMDRGTLADNIRAAGQEYCWENQEKIMIDGYKTYLA